jgi:hypothetical protein
MNFRHFIKHRLRYGVIHDWEFAALRQLLTQMAGISIWSENEPNC